MRRLPIVLTLAAALPLTACGGAADVTDDGDTTSPTASDPATTDPATTDPATTEPATDPTPTSTTPASDPTATASPTSSDCSAAGTTGEVNGAADLPEDAATT